MLCSIQINRNSINKNKVDLHLQQLGQAYKFIFRDVVLRQSLQPYRIQICNHLLKRNKKVKEIIMLLNNVKFLQKLSNDKLDKG